MTKPAPSPAVAVRRAALEYWEAVVAVSPTQPYWNAACRAAVMPAEDRWADACRAYALAYGNTMDAVDYCVGVFNTAQALVVGNTDGRLTYAEVTA